jgi:tetratricopeptide (TPR) repeat protein
VRGSIAAGLLVLGAAVQAIAQSAPPRQNPPNTQTDATSALEFLGSYTAPKAVLTTESSHTSAHPPSPPTDPRLRRIEGAFAVLPPWSSDFAWGPTAAEAACATTPGGESAGQKAPNRASDFQTQWLAADRALRQERFGQAAEVYDRILQSRPQCAPARWNRAVAGAYARSLNALAGLTSALPAAPSSDLGRLLIAVVRLLNGDLAAAQTDLAAISTEPSATYPGRPGGSSQQSRERPSAAPPSVKGARVRDILWARAMVAWAAGEPREARQLLARLAELEPASAAVWFELGGAALEEARANSRHLSEVAPESVWNRRLQAEAVEVRYPGLARRIQASPSGPSRESAESESSAISSLGAGDSPRELYLRTRYALRLSQVAYRRAAKSPRFQAYLRAMRALAAEQQDDEAAAMREYHLGLAENPQSALLRAGLGHLYRRRLDLRAAEQELAQAWHLDPSDPLVAFELGDVEQRLGKPEPALDLLNQALQLDAGLLVARWSRGKAYLAMGENERALADLEAAAPADSSGELQWQLARLYRKLGRADLAMQAEKRSEEQRKAVRRSEESERSKP